MASETENLLYNYYRKKQLIRSYDMKIKSAENLIIKLREDLKNSNLNMQCTLSSIIQNLIEELDK